MKQSKQYAKFTEINKRRWHNKIKETVKERELALQKEATTARVNEAMKQMKQSKQK